MTQRSRTVVASGLAFAEGPRWHEGRLWFSDMHAHRVYALDAAGQLETIVEVPTQPSGLGWDRDGALVVVSMVDRRVLRLEGEKLVEWADLAELAAWHCNDMLVDDTGRAYVGNFGFDLYSPGFTVTPANIALIDPDGRARVVADDLMFPNGMVITPDGSTLIVGESFAARLTAYDRAGDGALSNRRVWAQLDGCVPDGICLDAEGAVWLASPLSAEVVRVREGGEVLERISTGDCQSFACMLGGPERRTLYICTAYSSEPDETRAQLGGQIEAVEVDVPGAGLP